MKITKRNLIRLIRENLGNEQFEKIVKKEVKRIQNLVGKEINKFNIDYEKLQVPEYYRQYVLEKLIEELQKDV